LIFLYGAELFPTDVRSKGVGLAASFGRAFSMSTTFFNLVMEHNGINPMIVYGCLGFVVVTLVKHLPETLGTNLADVVPQSDDAKETTDEENESEMINNDL